MVAEVFTTEMRFTYRGLHFEQTILDGEKGYDDTGYVETSDRSSVIAGETFRVKESVGRVMNAYVCSFPK